MLTDTSVVYMQISASHMREVLEAFRVGRKVPPTPLKLLIPLQYRCAVVSYTEHNGESLAADAALIDWISVEITERLARGRYHYQLRPPEKRSSRSDAIAAMMQDFRMGAEELTLWSLLYYLYVVDIALSIEDIKRTMKCDERTVRRRRERALRRLAHHLLRNGDHSSE
jgi:hypothetical protein